MQLLASGLNRKEISEALNISLHTVNTHVERIYKKLGVHNAASATGAAFRENLLRDDHGGHVREANAACR